VNVDRILDWALKGVALVTLSGVAAVLWAIAYMVLHG
jgi:hypothetical protein